MNAPKQQQHEDAESVTCLHTVDHVAIVVSDIAAAVDWYHSHFQCEVSYRDETWALLQFRNVKLALVVPGSHPPHVGIVADDIADHGRLQTHRDGTRSLYTHDLDGNVIELLQGGVQWPS